MILKRVPSGCYCIDLKQCSLGVAHAPRAKPANVGIDVLDPDKGKVGRSYVGVGYIRYKYPW